MQLLKLIFLILFFILLIPNLISAGVILEKNDIRVSYCGSSREGFNLAKASTININVDLTFVGFGLYYDLEMIVYSVEDLGHASYFDPDSDDHSLANLYVEKVGDEDYTVKADEGQNYIQFVENCVSEVTLNIIVSPKESDDSLLGPSIVPVALSLITLTILTSNLIRKKNRSSQKVDM